MQASLNPSYLFLLLLLLSSPLEAVSPKNKNEAIHSCMAAYAQSERLTIEYWAEVHEKCELDRFDFLGDQQTAQKIIAGEGRWENWPKFAKWLENRKEDDNERQLNLAFKRNAISTTVKNAVIRGERDAYLFSARAGQLISLAITSHADNAVIALYFRQNEQWQRYDGTADRRVLYTALPKSESNRYKIVVGGTRGNATYEMFVGITSSGY